MSQGLRKVMAVRSAMSLPRVGLSTWGRLRLRLKVRVRVRARVKVWVWIRAIGLGVG